MTPGTAHASVIQDALAEVAVRWFLRVSAADLSPQERAEFLRWLRTSPRHVDQFLRTYRIHGRLRAVKLLKLMGLGLPVSSTVDNALGASALPAERKALDLAWTLLATAAIRDLVLWAEDPVPVAPRMAQALGEDLALPETTLRLMASHERQRRQKRAERLWWIFGLIATGIASPVLVEIARGAIGP